MAQFLDGHSLVAGSLEAQDGLFEAFKAFGGGFAVGFVNLGNLPSV